jgi:hypothetical protein
MPHPLVENNYWSIIMKGYATWCFSIGIPIVVLMRLPSDMFLITKFVCPYLSFYWLNNRDRNLKLGRIKTEYFRVGIMMKRYPTPPGRKQLLVYNHEGICHMPW